MTINDLYAERDAKLDEIAKMKKPPYPMLSNYFNAKTNITLVVIVLVMFLLIFAWNSGAFGVFAKTFDIVLFLVGAIIIIATYSSYSHDVNDYFEKTEDWKQYKKNLYEETELSYDYCISLSEKSGTVITPEKLQEMKKPTPKCPTCGSKNLKRVSGLRRDLAQTAFGVANPTARAQFECKDCGYKW